jgi:hypothetical protein
MVRTGRYGLYAATVVLFFFAAHALIAERVADKPIDATAPDAPVHLLSAQPVYVAEGVKGHEVAYKFEFRDRSLVYIKALGTVPAKGSFRYLTTEDQIAFLAGPEGPSLAMIKIAATIQVAAQPPLNEVASLAQFPRAYRSYPWASATPLISVANDVLQLYFRYEPQNTNGLTQLVTTFTPLVDPNHRDGVLADAALLVSFPYDHPSDNTGALFDFHVQTFVREGRKKSPDFRATEDRALNMAADQLIASIVADMRRKAGAER